MAFYYPVLNVDLPDGIDLDKVKRALDKAFATNMVKTLSKDGILIIDPGNHCHQHMLLAFFESLTRYRSLWIPLQPEEYTGRVQYSETYLENHVEVRYDDPRLKMVWNRITQIYEWV
jgi:hypothetical protein